MCVGPANFSYQLKLPEALSHMHDVFDVSALTKYKHDGTYQPPQPVLVNDEEQFEVKYISSTHRESSWRQYKVHWFGGSITWELEECLTNCPELPRVFWESKELPCPHPTRGETDALEETQHQ